MFVQDIEALRKVATRSVVDMVTARDLDNTREVRTESKRNTVLQQVRLAVNTKVCELKRKIQSAAERRRELIRELRFKKRRANAPAVERDQSRDMAM